MKAAKQVLGLNLPKDAKVMDVAHALLKTETNGFKSGCIYKSKANGKMYLCHGSYFSYEHKDNIYSINVKNFKREDFEEVVF